MSVTDNIGSFILGRTSRRGFLAKATVGAAALAVAPIELLTRPGTAYAAVCSCANASCSCSDLCCDGYTQFCCTINKGYNICPPGTFAGGWWKADGSEYCSGPRYYIDCHGECQGCGCPDGNFCPSCDGLTCECALGNCANRAVGCNVFRYGQCNTQIACAGRISCRVVSCTPPWALGYSCSEASATDDTTANHFASCQGGPTSYPTAPAPPPLVAVGMAATTTGKGYWLADNYGGVHPYGDAVPHGSMAGTKLSGPVVGIAATMTGKGYWLASSNGGVFAFGDAGFYGAIAPSKPGSPVAGIAADGQTGGYRLVTAAGGVYDYQAASYGTAVADHLATAIVGIAPTTDNAGYWLVAAGGGVFSFGDAGFYGSMGGQPHGSSMVAMVPTSTGKGYYLVAAGGGVFAFGDAGFYGSGVSFGGSDPIAGMAVTSTGQGYWLATQSGKVHIFGDAISYGQGV